MPSTSHIGHSRGDGQPEEADLPPDVAPMDTVQFTVDSFAIVKS
jgi:hypothetical protein